jgi:hypothetical protein
MVDYWADLGFGLGTSASSGLGVPATTCAPNDARIRAIFQQVGGEAMAERVSGDALGDSGALGRVAAGGGQRAGGHVPVLAPGGKQITVFGGRAARK